MAYMCIKGRTKECDGCGECTPETHYYCPICGEEVYESVYVANAGDVLGCENCAQIKEPDEMIKNEID